MRGTLPLLLLLAACSSGGGSPDPTAAPTTTPPTTAAPTVAPSPSPSLRIATERGDVHFRTPTGNIGCYLVADEGSVGCDIAEHTWRLPPRPTACDADWAATLSVARTGPAEVGACRSDTALGGPRVLAYGTGVRSGGIECVSETRGVTCRSVGSGRGFFLSRASYRVF